MTDSDPNPATPWPVRALVAALGIVRSLEDQRAVVSINISGYNGLAELLLTPEAWAFVAQGRAVTWDADTVRDLAHGTVAIGDIKVSSWWRKDELTSAAPKVAAQVFPAPQPKPTPTVTTWGGK